MNQFALFYIIIMGILTFTLPRKYVILPLLIVTFSMPIHTKLVVGDIDLFAIRIIILIALIRLLIRNELKQLRTTKLDYIIAFWLLSNMILFTLSHGGTGAFINRTGFVLNLFGSYLFFRCSIKDNGDIERVLYYFSYIVITIALIMFRENLTGENLYGQVWGVNQKVIERFDKLRCIGPFASPILAGTFGASLIPLLLYNYLFSGKKILSIMSIIASMTLIATSHSSGPIISLFVSIFGVLFWYQRDRIKLIRWLSLIVLCIIQGFMSSPVWYLSSRISEYVGGGTGWHRSEIITQSFIHINEWWLMGTDFTAHWMPYSLPEYPNMTDITNQYILQGVDAGILTMILFVAVLLHGFKKIGDGIRHYSYNDLNRQFLVWVIGTCLFTHCVTFMSIVYFDQTIIAFMLILAFISVITIESEIV